MARNPETVRQLRAAFAQALKDSFADNATQWAAAIAYYGFLSLFPLVLAAVSLSAYFVSADWATGKAMLLLREFLPEGDATVQKVMGDTVHNARPYMGLVSLVLLLVLGSRAFGALSRALNIAYEGEETGSLARRIVIEIAMMAAVAVLFIGTLFSHHLVLLLWNVLSFLPGKTETAYALIAQVVRVVLLLLAFYLVYRFVPRKRLHWKSIAVGTAVATSLLIAARPLFSGYVQNLANYNLVYGGIAIAAVLLVWGWVAAFITILGGEMAAHFQTMVLEGVRAQSVDRKRMHLKSVKRVRETQSEESSRRRKRRGA